MTTLAQFVTEVIGVKVTDPNGVFYGDRHHECGSTIEPIPRRVAADLFIQGRAVLPLGLTPSRESLMAARCGLEQSEYARITTEQARAKAEIEEKRRPLVSCYLRVLDPAGITVMRDLKTYAEGEVFGATSPEADAFFRAGRAEYADRSQKTPTPAEMAQADAEKGLFVDPFRAAETATIARRIVNDALAARDAATPDTTRTSAPRRWS